LCDAMGASRRLSVDSTCIASADSLEAATRIAWVVASAAVRARADIVVVHVGRDDATGTEKPAFLFGPNARGRNATFLARVLQYLETPPCLRRALVPRHADLAKVGSLPPESRVDFMPHHLRAHQTEAKFREGVVVADAPRERASVRVRDPFRADSPEKPTALDAAPGTSTLANIGLETRVRMDRSVKVGVRVTLAAPERESAPWRVTSRAPPRAGVGGEKHFWGYDVLVAGGSASGSDVGDVGEWREHDDVRYRIH